MQTSFSASPCTGAFQPPCWPQEGLPVIEKALGTECESRQSGSWLPGSQTGNNLETPRMPSCVGHRMSLGLRSPDQVHITLAANQASHVSCHHIILLGLKAVAHTCKQGTMLGAAWGNHDHTVVIGLQEFLQCVATRVCECPLPIILHAAK